ncbi:MULTISPECIES: hypothetical protein [Croceibacter]|jgi:hypothetical protein|uniref:Uncharacterized protein n=1 Tax=Croceibacter atlanticus (strain ATCC BAA-628 / JCM 21780 / CIP 108009 / IAM 15332 / KCTC 12090 / HTCC2559) TaxID=216432 RepID=A3UBB6_CROAH|nr:MULTISPECIES: hypothetical protein [Croceibacter]EAP85917.1 hypothetical protein CA2559_07791 [Croceibacter atlanticus HTCC2559]MBW4969235.1 hypothetical protein [Croceibacter atlanticus]WSP33602.1 hypothetical protein VVL01_09265 [Croceibacter atlanticus]|tara:strand:+ start:2536 stop:2679 length:144 start_codon:yes stop_codon:yes gene_type:complete
MKMNFRKIGLGLFMLGLMASGFTSCREEKSLGDEVEDVADDVEDAVD